MSPFFSNPEEKRYAPRRGGFVPTYSYGAPSFDDWRSGRPLLVSRTSGRSLPSLRLLSNTVCLFSLPALWVIAFFLSFFSFF